MKPNTTIKHLTALVLICGSPIIAWTQDASQQRLGTPSNQASLRYETNQTFDGSVFRRDQNVWAYTQEFADLFGMLAKHVDAVQGIAAVAFRIEDRNIVECGYGGKEGNCRKIEDCLLDLYFDETKTPLPWTTEIKSQWLPRSGSMSWLRPQDPKERPHGVLANDPPPGVLRNQSLHGQVIPFADPVSKREAIFASNITNNSMKLDDVSWGHAILGYTKEFYKGLSVVSLQTICYPTSRTNIHILLDAKISGIYENPIAKFNRATLPEGFVKRINEALKANRDKNAVFYRSLFPVPLGTANPVAPSSANTPSTHSIPSR